MGGAWGVWPIVDCFLAVVPAPPGCSSVFVLSFWIQFEVFFFKVWFERNIFRVVLQSHLRAECGVSAMSKYCFGGRFFGLKNFKIKSLFVLKKIGPLQRLWSTDSTGANPFSPSPTIPKATTTKAKRCRQRRCLCCYLFFVSFFDLRCRRCSIRNPTCSATGCRRPSRTFCCSARSIR